MNAAEMAYLTQMCERLKQYGALATEAHENGEHYEAGELGPKQAERHEEIRRHFGIGER